jgi:hypothetical protein
MSQHVRGLVRLALFVSVVALGVATPGARAQLLVVTPGDGYGTGPIFPIYAATAVFPDFGAGGASPVIWAVAPSDDPKTAPHGLALIAPNRALATNVSSIYLDVIDTSTAQRVDKITMPGFNGSGALAANPAKTHVLSLSFTATLRVIAAPFNSSSAVTTVALPSTGDSASTRSIAFHPTTGRAFLSLVGMIAVLDPPYSSIAFTIASPNGVPNFVGSGLPATGAIAVSPDGNTVVASQYDANTALPTLRIFHAPFTAASVPEILTIAGAQLDGMTFTPDGTKLLIVDRKPPVSPALSRVFAVSAPYGAASAVATLSFDSTFGAPGELQGWFEDVDVSSDGQLAALGGGEPSGGPLVVLKAPFTAAGGTAIKVAVPGTRLPDPYGHQGRGAGTARFWPTPIAPPPAQLFVDKSASVFPGIVVPEGNSGTTPAAIPVRLLQASAQTVTVDYQTVDGNAGLFYATAADGDYVPTTGTLTFAPGETLKNIVVLIKGDTAYEGDEYFTVVLTNPVNATILGPWNTGIVTIQNDDPVEPLAILTTALPHGTLGVPYTFTMQGTGLHPLTWNDQGVLGVYGLDFDLATGVISGAPSLAGTFNIPFRLTDPQMNAAFATLPLIIGNPAPLVALAPNPLVFAAQNVGVQGPAAATDLTNSGSANLVLGNPIYTLPGGADFVATAGSGACAAGQTLIPGASCKLWFAFKPLQSGARTLSLPLASNAGANALTLAGTGRSGNDATLSALTVSSGSLVPAFAPATFTYTDNVLSCVASIRITSTLSDPAASLTVNGVATPSGTASAPIALAFGANAVNVLVTAQDGVTTQNYGIAVNRPIPAPLMPVLQSAGSRRVHGAAGTYDLALSLLATNPTTEPRRGPAQTIVFTFDKAITGAVASITEGTAVAGTPTISGSDVVVGLTGVTDRQYVTLQLAIVASSDGGTNGCAIARVGFLVGDVNQNRVVSVADLGLINAQLSQPVTAANYLRDINATGTLTVADKGIANGNLSQALPAP